VGHTQEHIKIQMDNGYAHNSKSSNPALKRDCAKAAQPLSSTLELDHGKMLGQYSWEL
jgi:hypothetical protein